MVPLFLVIAAGCAHWPDTPRLEQVGASGYRPALNSPGQSDDLMVILAMSGGLPLFCPYESSGWRSRRLPL